MNTPLVSVVVPMVDELAHIEHCIRSIDALDWPPDRLEVIVVDGGSADGSRQLVAALAQERPWLSVIDNVDRRASSAFNRGIEAASGDLIALLSAHGEVGPTFVADSVAVLDGTGAAGVGGVLRHDGSGRIGRAIGLAMASGFGMASPFRYARERRVVDTIGHPVYRADVLREVGGFNESLERNSDYELNFRLRRAGHELVFDPSIVSTYRPRESLLALVRQFWAYGRAKAFVVRDHPASLKPRHAVPPLAVLAAVAAPFAWQHRAGRPAVGVAVSVYVGAAAAATIAATPRRHSASPAALMAAFPLMHLSWGSGFLWTLVRRWR